MSRTVLVTGAARGIGQATAQRLLAAGDHVIALDRPGSNWWSAPQPEVQRTVVEFDLALTDRIESEIRPVLAERGPVTGLVNNAGIVASDPLVDTSDESWQRILAVNLTAPFVLIRTLAPDMQRAGGGAIVNVASRNAYRSSTGKCGYDASKAGLMALTRTGRGRAGSGPHPRQRGLSGCRRHARRSGGTPRAGVRVRLQEADSDGSLRPSR